MKDYEKKKLCIEDLNKEILYSVQIYCKIPKSRFKKKNQKKKSCDHVDVTHSYRAGYCIPMAYLKYVLENFGSMNSEGWECFCMNQNYVFERVRSLEKELRMSSQC